MTTDPTSRKRIPLYSGLLKYFPNALCAVAECSLKGNEQHHPDKPLHWDMNKSTDEPDALMRHLLEAGTLDTDGIRHSAKVAWRALALLERELLAEWEQADDDVQEWRAEEGQQITEQYPWRIGARVAMTRTVGDIPVGAVVEIQDIDLNDEKPLGVAQPKALAETPHMDCTWVHFRDVVLLEGKND